jgi:hypothetical protein
MAFGAGQATRITSADVRATRTSRTIQRIAYDRGVRALGLAVLVAACSPSGLTLEVVISDPEIAKVEVMAGDPCGSDCPDGTIPPGLYPMPLDDAFVVLDPAPFTVSDNDFSDGLATFHIEGSGKDLAILVILGYDLAGNIRWSWSEHWVHIPYSGQRWQIQLEPTTQITPTLDRQPSGTERYTMWPDPGGHTSCLLLEHWTDLALPDRELIAPDSDHDCDGVAATRECAPWVPNAMGLPPTIYDTRCVVQGSQAAGVGVCLLGGPQCDETPGSMSEACIATDTPYCVSESFCTSCAGSPDPPTCVKTAAAQGIANQSIAYLKCVLHVDSSFDRCDSGQLVVDASPLLESSLHYCKALRFSDGGVPFPGFDDRLHVGEGKLRLDNFNPPCTADAQWEAGMAGIENLGLLDAEIDNGYHLVVPVRVEVRPGCDAANTPSFCALVKPTAATNETLQYCLLANPVGDVCAGDSSHTCPGPFCNGQCCGAGERCTQNGCACGSGAPCQDGDACATGGPISDNSCGTVCCGASGPCPQ